MQGKRPYMFPPMAEPLYSEEALHAAVEALSDPERFRQAEAMVAAAAPKLQRILAQALEEGGWFAESHEAEVRKAVVSDDESERAVATRTLVAEEARMGMLVGVAVGWALRDELQRNEEKT